MSKKALIVQEAEDKLLTIILASTNGHRRKAANALGISLRTIYRRIDERVRRDENRIPV